MPVYTLLGATGSTGSAILRCLLSQSPDNLKLNIFVRSEAKLRQAFPDLQSTTNIKINITEGVPSNDVAMQNCLDDVDVIFGCIASNVSTAGITIVHDTTSATIKALEAHQKKKENAYKTPTIVQLRSASVNPTFKAALPWTARVVAGFCFYYVYEDLERASELLESTQARSPGLLNHIYIDPPALHDSEGTTPTGYKLITDAEQATLVSYADLGAAFCEVAERREEFMGKGIGVNATGTVNQTWGQLMGYMAAGAKGRIWG